jgi:formate hydrogenlyase subunit 6/NADH:ubiquinone oxidoreductase subunit I
MLTFMAKLASNLFRSPRTEAFPFGAAKTPETYRGRVAVDESKCVGCSTCAQVCVCDAIHLEEEDKGVRLTVWHAHCSFCGLCEFYCPTDAIYLTNDWDLGHTNAEKFAMHEEILALYQTCSDCGVKLMVPNANAATSSEIGKERLAHIDEPRCDACRRKKQARQITGVRI